MFSFKNITVLLYKVFVATMNSFVSDLIDVWFVDIYLAPAANRISTMAECPNSSASLSGV